MNYGYNEGHFGVMKQSVQDIPLTPTGHQCPTIPGKDKNVMASEILSK